MTHLILDFDDTLTTTDTIGLLASAAYRLRPPHVSPLPPWSSFVDAYLADYAAHSFPGPRDSPEREAAYLSSLLPVERASVERIEAAGVFSGLHIGDIAREAASTVAVRPGFDTLLQHVLEAAGGAVDVLSVNWCRTWIQSALAHALGTPRDSERFYKAVGVCCNHLVCDAEGITTGKLTRQESLGGEGIWTAAHKATMMDELVAGRGKHTVVYVGDSSTDLMCLLKADFGIVVGDKLDGVCGRIGVELVGVEDGITKVGGQRLYKVRDLDELRNFLVERSAEIV